MDASPQLNQRRYIGFCETPNLWKNKQLMGIDSFEFTGNYSPKFLRIVKKKRRLGQLAEQFLFNQVETCDRTELLAENLQIQHHKNTIGELDALILSEGRPLHLEIIYKFYVYDDTIGEFEINHWIGPNRKDSLIEKLTKLKEKQLPLLHSSQSQDLLKDLNLVHNDFEQRVLFKAQLFVPYGRDVTFKTLNEDCLCGFYINRQQLANFESCRFYIPEKLDWFLKPNDTVIWEDVSNFRINSEMYLQHQQSPLFWMKNKAGELTKGFLVWW